MDMVILNNADDNGIPDELTQNYQDMDETGREELLKETEKILEVHKSEKKELDREC
jgi:vacuolar-type H+-ATPase subunit H